MRYWRTALGMMACLWLATSPCARGEGMLYPVPPAGPNIPVAWQGYVGYNLTWFNRGSFPTATTGSVNDTTPGALGEPGTVILTGNVRDPGPASGFKAGFTYWIDDPESVSLDADFFWVPQTSISRQYSSDAAGNPVLARPYFNAATNSQDVSLISAPAPVSVAGSLFDSISTTIMGAEANLKFFSPTCYTIGTGFGGFIGGRWLLLDETYQNLDNFANIGGGGASVTRSDTFAASNQFYGGQIGVLAQAKFWNFALTATAKLAIGENMQSIKVSGTTTAVIQPTGQVITDDQGFYAQHSNSGTFREARFTILPEANLTLQYLVCNDCRLSVGYAIFALPNTIRPVQQIDNNIVIQPLLSGNSTPPPSPPTFQQSTFVGQMFNLGLELRF